MESGSARNNIHQQAETRDYKQKHKKKNMSKWLARLSVKVVSKLMSCLLFSGAVLNATALTLLLESFASKSDLVAAA